MDPIQIIRKRSREEYIRLLRGIFPRIRSYAQVRGEQSAIIGIVLGIVLVTAFRLVVFVLLIAVLIGVAVWAIALPENHSQNSP